MDIYPVSKSPFVGLVSVGTAMTIAVYVPNYYPPEKQGERHPGHEHIEQSAGSSSAPAGFVYVTALSTSTLAAGVSTARYQGER